MRAYSDVVVKDTANGAGGLGFDSRAIQTGRIVVSSKLCCPALSCRGGPRLLLHALA